MTSFGWKIHVYLLMIGSALASLEAALAQSYPNKPIRLVVGIGPGAGIDILARAFAAPLSEVLDQPIVIDNRPGAGNLFAAKMVATAPPDGYTLLMGTIASHGILPVLRRDAGYDHIRDFTPISMVATATNVLVVNPSLPARTVNEFLTYARANPGKLLFGSPGVGSSIHLSMELLKLQTKTNMVHVPYKVNAIGAVIAGEIQAACNNLGSTLPHIRAGRLRALAMTSKTRSPHLPDVPTFYEAGVPLEVLVWYALFSPAPTPKPVVSKLNAETVKVLQSADAIRRLDTLGFDARSSTPDELAAWVRTETARWQQVVKDAGVTLTN